MNKRLTYMVGWAGVMVLGWGCSSEPASPPDAGGFTCQTGQTECNGSCFFVDRDPANCGTCGTICPSGTTCVSSACACQSGLKSCGNACVNTNEDGNNCGTCGTVCSGATPVCSVGACSSTCAVGVACGSSCVDTQASVQHCGACNNACPGGQVCTAGACTCQTGTSCAGACVDTQSNPANCGACGTVCPTAATCTAGVCVGGTGTGGGGGTGATTGTGAVSTTGGDSTGVGGDSTGGVGGDATGGVGGDANGGVGGDSTGGDGTGGSEVLECATEPTPGDGGVVIDGCCAVLCTQGDLTDADEDGVTDGWGFELQAQCVVPDSEVATGKDTCLPDPRTDLPEPGTGYWFPEVGDPPEPACLPACEDAAADAVAEPDGDGWGWEHSATCIVVGSATAAQGIPCVPETAECSGNGYVIMDGDTETCVPSCEYGSLTDVNDDCEEDTEYPGWGWEMGASCLVPGSASAPKSQCCTLEPRTELPAAGDGYMADTDDSGVYGDAEDEVCMPACGEDATYEEGCRGWGYEGGVNCIKPGSIAAAETVPCVYDAPTTDPPTGDGWDGNYTTTFFGEENCQALGADDLGNTYNSVCGSLSGQSYFAALGDRSSLWQGAECSACPGGGSTCVPSCPTTTCGKCYEVACNPGGTYSYPDSPDTHNGLCRTDQSVVVKIIDVCPHNHSNNTYWCTDERKDHIDISCDAFSALSNGRADIDDIGFFNAWVRAVDCSVGLGVHTITH